MATRGKTAKRSNPAQAARQQGWEIVLAQPVLRPLAVSVDLLPDSSLGAGFARLDRREWRPDIMYAPDRLAEAEVWAWVFGHCLFHLGLNHSDPAITGYLKRDRVHNAVACVAANRLLAALRLGKSPFTEPEYPPEDERLLAARWRRDGIPAEFDGLGTCGTAEDITGLVVASDSPSGVRYAEQLAIGLSDAVTKAVDRAAGVVLGDDGKNVGKQPWDQAMGWFISSFPLLGGLAAGFKIVADAEICRGYDISIAAVDASVAEIYINPKAGLNIPEWRFVLAHEMLHAGLRHGHRAMGRDPYIWNVACDYVINGWLTEMKVGEMPEGLLYDLELAGLSSEAVYDRIVGDVRRLRKLATLRGKSLGDILGEPLPLPREAGGGIDLDEFYRRALTLGLAYHDPSRGLLPAGLVEEIRVIDQPPITWDVALARWFEAHVRSPEPARSYARPSRRQASTPGIPRPGRHYPEQVELTCTFGVVLDTSGSMSGNLLGKALGTIAAYAKAKDVAAARLVYCDAAPHDAGYVPVDEIVDRVKVTGRGGTVLQPAIRFLERTEDFPADGPILIITDGYCDNLTVSRTHAYLIPAHGSLPFPPAGPVFRVE